MSTAVPRGNVPYSLDDIDIYCPDNVPYIDGLPLGALINHKVNILHIHTLIADKLKAKQREIYGLVADDPYANADNIDTFEGETNRTLEVIQKQLTDVSIKQRFNQIKTNHNNFRYYIARVNKHYIANNLDNIFNQSISMDDEMDEYLYKRGYQMRHPFTKKTGALTSEGYTFEAVAANRRMKLIDRDFSDLSIIRDSKENTYQRTYPQTKNSYATDVYERISSRLNSN